MDKSRWGTHETHCCVLHGCKYGDKDCPVVTKETKQDYICESCDYMGFNNVEMIEDYVDFQSRVQTAKNNGEKEVLVNTHLVHTLLNRNNW